MKPGITVKIPPKFVGLNNFRDLFDSTTDIGQSFPRVLTNTLLFVAVTVPLRAYPNNLILRDFSVAETTFYRLFG